MIVKLLPMLVWCCQTIEFRDDAYDVGSNPVSARGRFNVTTSEHPSQVEFQVELHPFRESELLGKRVRFERSTALGFSPDTILRVITEKPFLSHLEVHEYRYFRALKALALSIHNGSRLQKQTRADLKDMMQSARTAGGTPVTIDDLDGIPKNLSAPWRVVRRAFFGANERIGRRLLARLAYYDRLTVEFTRSRHMPERMERLKPRLAPSLQYWHSLGLEMSWEVVAVLDATLQHLCWLDLELRSHDERRSGSAAMRLTEPSRRPIRHWFDGLLQSLGLTDLPELHQFLARRNAIRYDNVISHDLLKKWASSQRTIPYSGAKTLLTACFGDKAGKSVEAMDLWNAKMFVFLTETICCFSKEPIEPLVAQSHIHERLKLLESDFLATKGNLPTQLFVV